MKLPQLALLAILGASLGVTAEAFPGRWRHHDPDFARRGFEIGLGAIRLGDEGGRIDAEVIDVRNNRQIECNLTNVKFSAFREGVIIKRVVVEYRNGQRDSVDLNDRDDGRGPGYWRPGFGRPGFPGMRGLRLMPGQSSEWLDIDDVADGVVNGRCVDRIMVLGDDIDFDRRDPRDYRRPGFDRGAMVMVTGFVKPSRPDFGRPGHGGHGHGGPGYGPGPRH